MKKINFTLPYCSYRAVSSFHRAISKQGNLLEDRSSGELPFYFQYADKNLLKCSSSGARVPLSAALAPGSLLCPIFWLMAWASLSRVLSMQDHLGLFSNLPPVKRCFLNHRSKEFFPSFLSNTVRSWSLSKFPIILTIATVKPPHLS